MAKENPYGPKGWTPDSVGNLAGKTYVITGANAGAGYEAAKIFLSKGASVVMLNRSVPKSEAAIAALKSELGADADVRYILMDLADLASVRQAAERVNAEVPHIDAFIGNAAIAQVATQQFTKDGFESQLGTNHYGHFLLTSLIFDRIVESKGRIVIVGSNGHKMGLKRIQFEDMNFDKNYNPHYTYCHSKFAQMMFAYELERRVKQAELPISVHVCHPGMAKTTLAQDESAGFIKFMLKIAAPFAQSAERGAWPEILCATEENLKETAYYGPTKRSEMAGAVGECTLEESVLDTDQARKLWELSEQETGITWALASHQESLENGRRAQA
ncbi:MAG: SDR family oxidoreductase [Pseudomonadota bacterium]